MQNIKSSTSLDAILHACDPHNMRGDCATGIAAITGALFAGRAPAYAHKRCTACNDHVFVGRPGAGKSQVVAALTEIAEALGVPCVTTWPKSYEAACAHLHEVMQRRIDPDDGGPPRFELVHPRILCVLDEQGSLNAAVGHGDGANCTVGGVQTLINRTADGVLPTPPRAETRKYTPWPELRGVTVVWARLTQVENGAALLAATRAGAAGAERRQAVWTVKNDPPRDAQGRVLTGAAFRAARHAIFADCFNLEQVRSCLLATLGARMSDALRGDLGGGVHQIEVRDPATGAVYDALEKAAHGVEEWRPDGGDAAYLLAQYWAGVRACVRGATCTDDDDWRWGAAVVERIHTTAEDVLSMQDSETHQRAKYDEVVGHFACTPFYPSGEDARAQDICRHVFKWVGRSDLRRWAFASWGVRHLVKVHSLVSGRMEACFFRKKEPRDVPPPDPPREGFNAWFLDLLDELQKQDKP